MKNKYVSLEEKEDGFYYELKLKTISFDSFHIPRHLLGSPKLPEWLAIKMNSMLETIDKNEK